jgi:decaprenylphospho-beta-D-erythro-pentofuranosid-2-ulose 2-reductase
VVLAVRHPASAPGVDALRARGLEVEVVAFDADATATHPSVVDAAFGALGDVDVALVAFGALGDQERAKRDQAAAVALAHTNFTGAVSVLTLLGERLRAQRHGAIVVLSSVAGERARRANYPYGATKAGVDAFAQGLGDELWPHGIHVMVVRPGFVRTKMTEGRPSAPMTTDAAAVAADIVSGLRQRTDIVWSPRLLRWVFAVMRHLPRPLFRRLKR